MPLGLSQNDVTSRRVMWLSSILHFHWVMWLSSAWCDLSPALVVPISSTICLSQASRNCSGWIVDLAEFLVLSPSHSHLQGDLISSPPDPPELSLHFAHDNPAACNMEEAQWSWKSYVGLIWFEFWWGGLNYGFIWKVWLGESGSCLHSLKLWLLQIIYSLHSPLLLLDKVGRFTQR